jgi:hypothetical protein
MSRSGYNEDCDYDEWQCIRWRGAVASAIRGKRGQAFLKEMLAALDALPAPRLIAKELVKDGEVCAMGAVALARGLDVSEVDPECYEIVAALFGVSEALVREIAYENDEAAWSSLMPEKRFEHMHKWIAEHIR